MSLRPRAVSAPPRGRRSRLEEVLAAGLARLSLQPADVGTRAPEKSKGKGKASSSKAASSKVGATAAKIAYRARPSGHCLASLSPPPLTRCTLAVLVAQTSTTWLAMRRGLLPSQSLTSSSHAPLPRLRTSPSAS